MKPLLKPGLKHRFSYRVPENKTVPHLYREAPQLQAMPTVFATGFMVGLMEWTCVQLLEPHLDTGEGSLGVHIDVSHTASTVTVMPGGVAALCETSICTPRLPSPVSRCGSRSCTQVHSIKPTMKPVANTVGMAWSCGASRLRCGTVLFSGTR